MTLNKNFKVFSLIIILLGVNQVLAATKNWKINSDSSITDFSKNSTTHSGNVTYQDHNNMIKGSSITAQETAKGELEYIKISGMPAHLNQSILKQSKQLSAKLIVYQVDQQEITAHDQVHFITQDEEGSVLNLKGEFLQFNQAIDYSVEMSGAPLIVLVNQPNKLPITIQAKQLFYQQKTGELALSGEVNLSRQRKIINADKLFYNLKTGVLRMPKSPNKQVEIIQTKTTK